MALVFPLRRGPMADAANVIAGWRISSFFGNRIDPITGQPGRHGGMDLTHGSCFDAEIIAVTDGRIVQAWDPDGGGRWTSLFADDGSYWGYGHANRYAAVGGVDPLIGGARRVQAGDVIAFVGDTGHSKGAHLHIAFKTKATAAYSDPFDLLTAAAQGGRFTSAAVATAPVISNRPTLEEDMPDQFSFPDGTTYVLSITADSDTGFAWVHIGSPGAQSDAASLRLVSPTVRPLAAGNDRDDALFERHPVLSGPHRRVTHA